MNKLFLSVKKILSNGRSRWRHERSEFFIDIFTKENHNYLIEQNKNGENTMNFIKKVIKKIKEGLLQEMYVEAKWMYQYIKRYKFAVAFYLILGVISTLMGLGGSVLSKYLIRNADVKFFRLYAAFRFRNVQRLADCGFQILNVEPLPARKTAVIARTETLHVENAFRGFVADHYGYFFRADVQHGDVVEFCHYSLISLIYIYYSVRTRARQAFKKTFYIIFRVYAHICAHYVPIYAHKRVFARE